MKDILQEIEILKKKLEEEKTKKDNKAIVIILNDIMNKYILLHKPKEVIQYCFEILPYYENNDNTKLHKANTIQLLGHTHLLLGKYEKAMEFLLQALDLFKALKDDFQVAYSLRMIGSVHQGLGDFEKSLSSLFSASEILESKKKTIDKEKLIKPKRNLGNVYELIGILYGKLKQPEKAEKFFNFSLKIYEELNEQFGISKILNNLGVLFSETNPMKTLKFYKKSLEIVKTLKAFSLEAAYTNNIGGVYEDIKDYENAIIYYMKALKICEENKIDKWDINIFHYLGNTYFKKQEYNTAIDFAAKSLNIAIKNSDGELTRDNYQLLSKIYKQKGESSLALDFYEKYSVVKDKILNSEMIRKISGLQAKFEETSKQLIDVKKFNSLITSSLKKSMQIDFIGTGNKIKEVLELAMTAAAHKDANVLITGESGTGKEIIAHIIHYASCRKDKLFVPINSSSVPSSLAESEFFGHIKGSFTGAYQDKIGFLEKANKGTLFLDEIADTPASIQAKFLRVLENKKITRIGATDEIKVDFRIISATNKNLKKMIDNDKFRVDLLYRLNTIEIKIPPLRERTEDIEPLVVFFVNHFSKAMNKPIPQISKEVLEKLGNYQFPGNVRELRNMVEKGMILMKGSILESEHFETINTIESESADSDELFQIFNLFELEKQTILKALARTNNNKQKAANILGISRATLFRKLKTFLEN